MIILGCGGEQVQDQISPMVALTTTPMSLEGIHSYINFINKITL